VARANGLATGNVSTAELTDATPAALGAHVNDRGCAGPVDMRACPAFRRSAGGPGSIAEQLVDHDFDVLLGGGRQRFAQPLEAPAAESVTDTARARGYAVVTDAAG